MQIDSVASPPSSRFCFHEFKSVTSMEFGAFPWMGLLLFCFSSRDSEKIYKVSQVLLLMTYKKAKAFLSFQPGPGGEEQFLLRSRKNNKKNHPKKLTNQKGKL